MGFEMILTMTVADRDFARKAGYDSEHFPPSSDNELGRSAAFPAAQDCAVGMVKDSSPTNLFVNPNGFLVLAPQGQFTIDRFEGGRLHFVSKNRDTIEQFACLGSLDPSVDRMPIEVHVRNSSPGTSEPWSAS
jgi:hypothetical protein